MNYRAPLSARSRRSISVSTTSSTKGVRFNRQQIVSRDEVNQLKEKKNELLEERKLLKSKIARLQVQTKRAGKPVSSTPHLLNRLKKEYNSLEAMIKEQNEQITKLKKCDETMLHYELREEAKVVFLERSRLQDVQLQQQLDLYESQRELDELVEAEGPNTLKKQKKKMAHYDNIIKKYKDVNSRLTKKIKAMRAVRAAREDVNQAEIKARAEELERQISDAKHARKAYEEKLKKTQEEHVIIMQQLREKLGLDQ
ncbi:hypothetical protein TRFO_26874 [Tritrichomonas foetus]|uniref:Uncharacterized protein n=1 Tax=Tritrichomonas foetus TaxID=1144522 RepID=A0A1J4K6V4_9EUKA|nr:hypothetical protein TRFO_26874 [Tritrichomonas foetus]|eukprot:OHT05446.1 hypothetical protein TRFO_26874 [Tritrichomonas foetus]